MNAPVTQIVEFSPFEASLAEYKGRYENVLYDFDEPDQEKQARSDRLAIGKTVAKLDAIHKGLKAPIKAQADLLDGERKRIKDDLLEVQGKIKSQITQHEEKLKAIEDEVAARVQAIKDLAGTLQEGAHSTIIQMLLNEADEVVIDDSFGNHEANAALAKMKAIEALNSALKQAVAREAQEAENERLRAELAAKEQAEREERIASEAREQAEAEALEAQRQQQAAEQAAKEAAEQLAAEKVATAEKAKQWELDAAAAAKRKKADREAAEKREAELKVMAEERAAAAAEQARQDEVHRQEQEQAREQAEIAKREANTRHRGKFNREASEAIQRVPGVTEAQAKKIVQAIVKGMIPNISINY